MRCPHDLCVQPIVINHGTVGWCKVGHRIDERGLRLALWKELGELVRASTTAFRALTRTARRATQVFNDFNRAVAAVNEVITTRRPSWLKRF